MEPLSSEEMKRLERAHPEGLPAAVIVELVGSLGAPLAEATFRKYVQLGLLPTSKRVGRKGKHKGSHGLYPAAAVGRLLEIRALMDAGLTLEEIRRSHLAFAPEIDGLKRGFEALLGKLEEELLARGRPAARVKTLRGQAQALVAELDGAVRDLLPPVSGAAAEHDPSELARQAEQSLSGRHPARLSAAARRGQERTGARK